MVNYNNKYGVLNFFQDTFNICYVLCQRICQISKYYREADLTSFFFRVVSFVTKVVSFASEDGTKIICVEINSTLSRQRDATVSTVYRPRTPYYPYSPLDSFFEKSPFLENFNDNFGHFSRGTKLQ